MMFQTYHFTPFPPLPQNPDARGHADCYHLLRGYDYTLHGPIRFLLWGWALNVTGLQVVTYFQRSAVEGAVTLSHFIT